MPLAGSNNDYRRVFENHTVLLSNKIPFQKREESSFTHAPALLASVSRSHITAGLIQELIDLKKEKSVRSKYGNFFLSIFFVGVVVLFAISFS